MNTNRSAISGTPPQFRMILGSFHTFVMTTHSLVTFSTSSKVKVTWYVTLYTVFAKLMGNSNTIRQKCMPKLKKWLSTFPWQVIRRKMGYYNISDAQVSKKSRWRTSTLNPIPAYTEIHYAFPLCLVTKIIFLVLLRRFAFERLGKHELRLLGRLKPLRGCVSSRDTLRHSCATNSPQNVHFLSIESIRGVVLRMKRLGVPFS